MTKEPFDIAGESSKLFFVVEQCKKHHDISCLTIDHIKEFGRRCFSQGREQGLEQVAQSIESTLKRGSPIHISYVGWIRSLKSKEVSGKEVERE